MQLHGPDSLEGPVSFTGSRLTASARKSGRTHEESEVRDRTHVRLELVERIREEIALGTYLTQEKWEVALDRLFRALEND
jgi:hypothetical protein